MRSFEPESGRLLRVTFIDVGQGDAALIECPAGERILVDAGEKTVSHDVGEKSSSRFCEGGELDILMQSLSVIRTLIIWAAFLTS